MITATEQKIVECIRERTRENPITGREIIARFNLPEPEAKKRGAKLRKYVNDLRVQGYPICASGDGYFWPCDAAELNEFIASLEGRARAIQDAADGMRRGVQRNTV